DGKPVAFGGCTDPAVLTFTARRVVLDPQITPLVGRRLRLDALDVEQATLDLPVTESEFELPTWPEVLPRIDLPLALESDAIRVDGLRVTRAGAPLIDIASIRGGLDARRDDLRVHRLVVDSDRGLFSADGRYAPRDNYRTDLVATAVLPAPFARPRPRVGLIARGDLDHMDLAIGGRAPGPLRAHVGLRGQRWSLRAHTDALDPSRLAGSGDPGTPLAFSLEAEGPGRRRRRARRAARARGAARQALGPARARRRARSVPARRRRRARHAAGVLAGGRRPGRRCQPAGRVAPRRPARGRAAVEAAPARAGAGAAPAGGGRVRRPHHRHRPRRLQPRSEEHTSELQSRENLVC